ncbi:hypothetical protein JXA48_01795 [Candidatus Woesearchaeota archaeon]|nr:hypothetical protein [Candidatus Woesearchaeota archaeon]
MALTPELIQGSFVLMVIIYVVAFAFQIYVLYLNWKQSKVNDQMAELISEVKAIRKELNKSSSKKKRILA